MSAAVEAWPSAAFVFRGQAFIDHDITAGCSGEGDIVTNTDDRQHRSILQRIARRAMLERGLAPDVPVEALAELDAVRGPATGTDASARDLRNLLWCSIDNDDSRDLDQLTVAEAVPAGAVKILVAIADVDAVVRKRSALDDHARHNTTSVYTVAEIFPMLPERLSTDLTSLNTRPKIWSRSRRTAPWRRTPRRKVERQVGKSAAAVLLESRIGEPFDAIVTGASEKGTWVRIVRPPVEGRLERGSEGVDVGHRLRVRLIHTDVERGYIDFARVPDGGVQHGGNQRDRGDGKRQGA